MEGRFEEPKDRGRACECWTEKVPEKRTRDREEDLFNPIHRVLIKYRRSRESPLIKASHYFGRQIIVSSLAAAAERVWHLLPSCLAFANEVRLLATALQIGCPELSDFSLWSGPPLLASVSRE